MPKTARKTLHGITPGAPGWVDDLVTFHRATFGGARMEAADETGDDKGGEADDGAPEDKGDKEGEDVDWKAKFEAQQRINRTLERRTKKDAARLKDLDAPDKAPGKPESDDKTPDLDKIRNDAKAEAQREALHGRVEDKIEAKARLFADPEDAVAVLLRSRDINDFIDDDKVDADAIADALNELGEKKPHLLAQGKRFKGGADGGARKAPEKQRPQNLGDAVASHYTPEKE